MSVTTDELRSGFENPLAGSAPMMRWWWFGPAVDRVEIDRELTVMASAGIGGVEVAYVYPLSEHSDEFGSPEFLANLRYAAEAARALGLRFDLTLGSGWSFGGPHITAEHAARKLVWERREIGPGSATIPVVSRWPGDELIAVYLGAGSMQETPDELSPVPVVDGSIEIPTGRRPPPGAARVRPAHRPERQARGPRGRGPGAGPLQRRGRPIPSPPCRRSAARGRPRPADRLGVLRQPRGVRQSTGRRTCWPSSRPAAATIRGPTCTGWSSTVRMRRGCARTTTGPFRSCTRITSSRCSSNGPPSTGCRSGSRATARRREWSAAIARPTFSRARAGGGRTSPRPAGRPRPPTCTAATWCPRRLGPGCTHPPSGPPRSTCRARRTSTCCRGSTSSSAMAGRTRPQVRPKQRAGARLVLLRRGGAGRSESLVAGHGAADALSDPAVLADAPGRTGRRRGCLRTQRGRVRPDGDRDRRHAGRLAGWRDD